MNDESKLIQVRVAVRCRPLSKKETEEGCRASLNIISNHNQIELNSKCFTYDHVFSPTASQLDIYSTSVNNLIDNLFNGFNVTILAYGQTGSGKTYTMGTNGVLPDQAKEGIGIIPRVVEDIFSKINDLDDSEFLLKVSFLEIYKEEIIDLLVKTRDFLPIREDCKNGIHIPGLTEHPVTSFEDTLEQLAKGTLARSTAATNMNNDSSRSHAIFTINLEKRSQNDPNDVVKAKLRLVDLAGSERAKKTGAMGERLKEGIKINRGLLALGNVISSLCEDGTQHIPYRDSKLTRLLQDSLGGNSHTIMIACVSPADSNMEETLNTLRYANRARNIKNKPIVNRDPYMAELMMLREMVQTLKNQANENSNISDSDAPNPQSSIDCKHLLKDNERLKSENKYLSVELQMAIEKTTEHCEKALSAESDLDMLLKNLKNLIGRTENTIEDLNTSLNMDEHPEMKEQIRLIRQVQNQLKSMQTGKSIKQQEFALYSPKIRRTISPRFLKNRMSSPIPENEEKDHNKDALALKLELDHQLQELDKDLVFKENLIKSIKEAGSYFSAEEYQSTIQNMESEITKLQKEKDELFSQLKTSKSSEVISKVSENRRKRLQELEQQINSLRTELSKKNKMLKVKEESDRKVKLFQSEIQNLKQTRVKLLRKMKDESEVHRQWKNEKNREVFKLKEQNKKRQFQLVKMERIFSKEKHVMQRKLEAAAAANKKLQLVKDRQQRVREERQAKGKIFNNKQIDEQKIKLFLKEEIEVESTKIEAKFHLKSLINDRKSISKQINAYQASLDAAHAENTEELDHKLIEQLKKQIDDLKKDCEARTKEISSIQEEIFMLENEEDKGPWDNIHSLEESKLYLRLLMKDLILSKTEHFHLKGKQQEDNENHLNVVRELEQDLALLKKQHAEEIAHLTSKINKKNAFLLVKEQQSQEDLDKNNMDHQENFAEKMENLQRELKIKTEECEKYKKQQEQPLAKKNASQTFFQPVTPLQVSPPTKKAKSKRPNDDLSPIPKRIEFESDESDPEDDTFKDPDWRNTPLHKRKISNPEEPLKNKTNASSFEDTTINEPETFFPKPTALESSCKCATTCKRCICKRSGRQCSSRCKCKAGKCQNRPKDQENQDANETFTLTKDPEIKSEKTVLSKQNHNHTFSQIDSLLARP